MIIAYLTPDHGRRFGRLGEHPRLGAVDPDALSIVIIPI
jgi:hypothetical protein